MSRTNFSELELKVDPSFNTAYNDDDNVYLTLLDGPPFPNGKTLHLGHVLIASFKDTIIRFRQLTKHRIKHNLGYDCHGLPVETEVSKMLGLKTVSDIYKFGLKKYIEECKKFVNNNIEKWQPLYNRIGRQMHFGPAYKTMDMSFMNEEWKIFNQLVEKKLVYHGSKVMPYCTHCETTLSISEATSDEVYKTITTRAVNVKFKIINEDAEQLKHLIAQLAKPDDSLLDNKPIYLIAFTTTPWTLPGNVALAIGQYEYDVTLSDNEIHILLDPIRSIAKIKYTDLIYKKYHNNFNEINKILLGPFVSQQGTGIVHIAPAFGADDYKLCIDEKIITPANVDQFCHIDNQGNFTREYANVHLSIANKNIIKDLSKSKIIISEFNIKHSYPHCWRCDAPLIYKAMPSWFIATSSLTEQMVDRNNLIKWQPNHIGHKRFRNWLEESHDWCVSRNRVWGTPLPIWISDNGDILFIKNVEELERLANVKINDMHLDVIKDISIMLKNPLTDASVKYNHCGLIFDCWFDSGCVSVINGNIGQVLCEGLDQTRGWFYTSHVLNCALNKNNINKIICNGLILAADGKKFSKRLGNFVDPMILCDKYGADALRLCLLDSPATTGDTYQFDERQLSDINKKFITLLSALSFLEENISVQPNQHLLKQHLILDHNDNYQMQKYAYNTLDNWLEEQTIAFNNKLYKLLSTFSPAGCKDAIIDYIDFLTNWYIRLNRKDLKYVSQIGERMIDDRIDYKNANYSLIVLFHAMRIFTICISPLMPFMATHIYNRLANLTYDKMPLSNQLFKTMNVNNYKEPMNKVKQYIEMARFLRQKAGIASAKKPIKELKIIIDNDTDLDSINCPDIVQIIKDEVNAFDISVSKLVEKEYLMELNIPLIKKRFKENANMYLQIFETLDKSEIAEIHQLGVWQIADDYLKPPEYTISVKPSLILSPTQHCVTINDTTVIIDTEWSEQLEQQYFMRLLTVEIQNMRKEAGLKPINKVKFYCYNLSEETKQANVLFDIRSVLEKNLGYPVIIDNYKEKAIYRKNLNILSVNIDVVIVSAESNFSELDQNTKKLN